MAVKAIAKYKLIIRDSIGRELTIMPGDAFDVIGATIAFKGYLINVQKYADAFKFMQTESLPAPVSIKVTRNIRINDTVIPANTIINVASSDIVQVNGVVFDIAKYSDSLEVVEYSKDPNYEIPFRPSFDYAGNLSERSLKDNKQEIKNGSGTLKTYASSVNDGLLELFLIPAIAGKSVIPSVNGAYEVSTEDELSVSFGATKLSDKQWESIMSEYLIKLRVSTDVSDSCSLTFTNDGIVADSNVEYVITDSYKDDNTIQNATRIRFLVAGKLLRNQTNSGFNVSMFAKHRKTGHSMNLGISVMNRYTGPMAEPTEPPKPSVYDISTITRESVKATVAANFTTRITSSTVGDIGYKHAGISFEVTEKPEGGEARFNLPDSAPAEFTNSGSYGPAEGNELTAEYDKSIKYTIVFNKAGTYKIKTKIVDKDNKDTEIVSKIATVTVAENQQPEPPAPSSEPSVPTSEPSNEPPVSPTEEPVPTSEPPAPSSEPSVPTSEPSVPTSEPSASPEALVSDEQMIEPEPRRRGRKA